jgi:hypothetical protein
VGVEIDGDDVLSLTGNIRDYDYPGHIGGVNQTTCRRHDSQETSEFAVPAKLRRKRFDIESFRCEFDT